MGRTIGWVLAILVLLLAGFSGLHAGINDWKHAETPLQVSATGGVLTYAVLALIGAAGLSMRKAWCIPVIVAWAVVVTYVPGAAVMGYAPEATWGAALVASASAALIGGLVVWAARVAVRRPSPSRSAQTT